MDNMKTWILLHCAMAVYSFANICSKMAGMQDFPSAAFLLWCGGLAAVMVVYALLWQQALKKLPLMTAYANKAVVILWGFLWGRLFFHEPVGKWKLFGAAVVMAGVYLMVTERREG